VGELLYSVNFVYYDVWLQYVFVSTATVSDMKPSEQTANDSRVDAIKFARWQHPAMGRG